MLDLSIYLRPLCLEDAAVSYHWRNDPRIWRYTFSRPDTVVSYEMEKEWLANVLKRENEKRFAICLKENDQYIGNIFLTDIKDGAAYLNIFIGAVENWGRHRALEAVILIGIYGFAELGLEKIVGLMEKRNIYSNGLARLFGPESVEEIFDEKTGQMLTRWVFTRKLYEEKYHYTLIQNLKAKQKQA